MADKWIPVRERLPEDEEWVQVQTQDGTIYPAKYVKNTWSPLFRGGLVEHLMHGKVAYWAPHEVGYPYVQCKCGSFYLQAEGRKDCPICATLRGNEKKKPKEEPKAEPKVEPKEEVKEEIPFTDDLEDLALLEE